MGDIEIADYAEPDEGGVIDFSITYNIPHDDTSKEYAYYSRPFVPTSDPY